MIQLKEAAIKYKITRTTLASYCRKKLIKCEKRMHKIDHGEFFGGSNQNVKRPIWFIDESSLVEFLGKK